MAAGAFYELTIQVTDPGGLSNTCRVQWTVTFPRYDGFVTWSPYTNQSGWNGNDVPNDLSYLQKLNVKVPGGYDNNTVAFDGQFWSLNASGVSDPGHFRNTTKRGLICNWTDQLKVVAVRAYKGANTGASGRIEGKAAVSTSLNPLWETFFDSETAAAPQKYYVLGTLLPFTPTDEEIAEGVVPGMSGTTSSGQSYDYSGCILPNVQIQITRNTLTGGAGESGECIFLQHANDTAQNLPLAPGTAYDLKYAPMTNPPFPVNSQGDQTFPYNP